MMVGYARVSTEEQSLDLQTDALRAVGCESIFCDAGVSGSAVTRPALADAFKKLQKGDVLVTWRLDRLGRSLSHLISLIAALEKRGVAFRSLAEAIDTSSAPGRLMFHVLGALAEFERSLIVERTTAGLSAARARGKMLGRPRKLSVSQIEAPESEITREARTLSDAAKSLTVSTSTLQRALRKRKVCAH